MGKARDRRLASRRRYLRELSVTDPARFREEWNKRLESWARLAAGRAHRLVDEDGSRTPSAFGTAAQAVEELVSCGPAAVAQELTGTARVMQAECAAAVAAAVDPRLHRLANTAQVCRNAQEA